MNPAISAQHVFEAHSKKMYVSLFFIVGYIMMSPFYLFPSGTPQIADMFVSVGVLFCFLSTVWSSPRMSVQKNYFMALCFATYTFLVNGIYFAFLQDHYFLLSSFYYIYNVSMFIFISFVIRKDTDRALNLIYLATAAIIIVQVVYLFIEPSYRGPRATGSFINPNQLSYWSWFCAAILIVLKLRKGLTFFDFALLLCVGFIQTMSLSKAGIICYLLVLVALPFSNATPRHYKLLFLGLATAFAVFALMNFENTVRTLESYEGIDRAVSRLEKIGEEVDDSAEGRGYGRIFNNPEYLLIGAGEGGYYRFQEFSKALELHSGVGTIFFSYGFVGILLFIGLLLRVSQRNDPTVLYLIGLALLYGLVHQNIRFTHFWVFLGVCDGMRYVIAADKKRKIEKAAAFEK